MTVVGAGVVDIGTVVLGAAGQADTTCRPGMPEPVGTVDVSGNGKTTTARVAASVRGCLGTRVRA